MSLRTSPGAGLYRYLNQQRSIEIFAELGQATNENKAGVKHPALMTTKSTIEALWRILVSSTELDGKKRCPYGVRKIGGMDPDCEACMDQYRTLVLLYKARLLFDKGENVELARVCEEILSKS